VNLAEVLLAGLLFSLASAGSLEVMAGLGRSQQRTSQAQAAEVQLEAELRRSQALVRAGAEQQQATDLACEQPALLLSRLLTDPAPGEGNDPAPSAATPAPLVRQVSVLAPGLVRLQLGAAGGRWQRQRLFSAAAYGLCPPGGGTLG
jgi:type II secretory pathway component PulJ